MTVTFELHYTLTDTISCNMTLLPLIIVALPFVYAHSWVERVNLLVDGSILLDPPGFARANGNT